jgi:hypothetical protein
MTLLLFLSIIVIVLIFCYNKIDSEKFTQTDDIKAAINKTYNLDLQPIKDLIDQTDLHAGNTKNFANSAIMLPNKILNVSGSLHPATNVTANKMNISNIRAVNNANTNTLITKDLSGQDLNSDDLSCNHINITSDTSKILSIVYTNDITFKNGEKLSSYENKINKEYNKITQTSLDNISSTDKNNAIYQDPSGTVFINNLSGNDITTNNVTANTINSNIINSSITDINNYRFYKNKDALVIGEIATNNNIVYPSLILNASNDSRGFLINKLDSNNTINGYNLTDLSNQIRSRDDLLVSKYNMVNDKYHTKGMPIYDTLDSDGKYDKTIVAPNQKIPA